MYCNEVTEAELSKLKPSVTLYPNTSVEKTIPFQLQQFDIDVCQEAIDYFNSIINFDLYQESIRNDPTRPKIEYKAEYLQSTPEHRLVEDLIFMENERIMCKWDCNYWQDRYYKISNHENKFVQFSPNASQKINRKIRERAQRAKKAINKLTLKARQLGETTDEIGVKIQRLVYFPDVKSAIASYEKEATWKMSNIFTNGVDRLPYWNRPGVNAYDKKQYWLFENNSLLDLGWGTQDSIGRGSTYTVGHFTEIAKFIKPVEAIEDAFFNAQHESVWTLITLEGTAEGRDDWFHRIWKDLVIKSAKGLTSFVPRFYPWCLRDDIKPTETWIRGRAEAFANYVPSSETIQHVHKVELYIKSDADLRAELPNFKMSLEKMFWYETEKKAAQEKKQLQNFLKEQPSDPAEAFQHAGKSIYDVDTIIRVSDAAQQEVPDVYKLRGDISEINPELFPTPDEIDFDKKIIDIRANWKEEQRFEYELVPIKFNGWGDFDPTGKFLIWEHPITNATYGIGTDTSDGLGIDISDDAVMCCLKKGTIEYKDKQVMEFASPEIPQGMFGHYQLAISTYFSPETQALLAISIDEGTELLNWMINVGWYNHHEMLDRAKMGQGERKIKKLGFETNRQTRPDLITHVNSFILGNWIELFSMPLIGQLQDLEKITTISRQLGQTRTRISGKKDDRFMALGMTLYSLHLDEFLGFQKKAWEVRIANENSNVSFKEMPKYDWDKEDEIGNAIYALNEDDEFEYV